MQTVAAAETWPVPSIESTAALADWPLLDPGELGWFANLRGLGCIMRASPQLWQYHYRMLAKRSGSIRLIEAPEPRLKELQRRILCWILDKNPSHSAVHGFVKGRSIRTLAAPRDAWKALELDIDPVQLREARALYAQPHLPRGAPTSPALANLCAYRVDCRLAGLAKAAGAEYNRYADDLAFSGGEEFERRVERFSTHVAVILHEEGFTVHHRRTRIMRQGVRQHLAGLVANRRANVMRADFDRLKATLTNCVRLGPESQNRDAHPRFRARLEGRVGFVEMLHPAKGKRLRTLFGEIEWL